MTQCERVLKYMQDFGSINPKQAMEDLGVMRLAARVADLKKAGYKITKRSATGCNRYDEKVIFAEYILEEQNAEQDISAGAAGS